MAEAIAAVSLVSAITQLVEFGSKIIARLNEARSSAGDLPKCYRDIQTELPLLVDILKRTEGQIGSDHLNESTRQALVPVIEGCSTQVKILEGILSKGLSLADDTWQKRGTKAFLSVYQEKKMEHLVTKLHGYIQILTYHEVTKFAKLVAPALESERYYEVPARSVPNFIGREDVLSDMDYVYDTASTRPVTLVIRGMGGQGKTQLALEFCRRAYKRKRLSAIFWVDATSETMVKKGMERIFEIITPPQQVFPDTEAKLRHVKTRLKGWQTPWLVVFDNYDHPSGFPNIREYMPSGDKGCYLVTSRHGDSERLGYNIKLLAMQEDEALQLLLKRADLDNTTENALQGLHVVKRLGYHALAVDQAAAYVRKRGLPLGLFMEHYKTRKERVLKDIPKVWEYRRTLSDAEGDTAMSVFTTWELAVQQLGSDEEDRRRKLCFLTISAHLDHTNISGNMFKAYSELGSLEFGRMMSSLGDEPQSYSNLDWLQLFGNGEQWSHLDFEDALVEMRDLCLVQSFSCKDKRIPNFSLHPLIRDWIRTRASTQERHQGAVQATLIVASFLEAPLKDKEPRPFAYTLHPHLTLLEKQELLGHMMVCGENIAEDPPYGFRLGVGKLEDAGERFARFYDGLGRYNDAQLLYERVLDSRLKRFGPEDRRVLKGYSQVAFVCRHLGKYDEATRLLRLTLAIQIRTLGLDDPETLTSLANVAVSLWYQGKYEVAERLDRIALHRREKVFGPDHHITLSSVSNLALTLQYQVKHEEAEVMHRRAVDGRQRQANINSARRDNLWTSLGNLAIFLKCQGDNLEAEQRLGMAMVKYLEAQQLCRRVLQAKSDQFGESHPVTLTILSNMADILRRLEYLQVPRHEVCSQIQEGPRWAYEQSETAYRNVLEKRQDVLGELHPHTLESLENLALVYRDQLRFEEAAVLRRRAIEGYEKLRGTNHAETLEHIEGQVDSLDMITERAEAEQLQQRVLEGRRKLYGDDDSRTRRAALKMSALKGSADLPQAEGQTPQKPRFRRRCFQRGNRQGYN